MLPIYERARSESSLNTGFFSHISGRPGPAGPDRDAGQKLISFESRIRLASSFRYLIAPCNDMIINMFFCHVRGQHGA